MRILHVIDSSTSRDGLLQLGCVAGGDDVIASVSAPPQRADFALPVRPFHAPLGIGGLCGRRMRSVAAAADAVCAWGVSALAAAMTASEHRAVLTVIPSSGDRKTRRQLSARVRRRETQLVVPTEAARKEWVDSGTPPDGVHVLRPPAAPPRDAVARRARVRAELGLDDTTFALAVLGEMRPEGGHRQAVWGAAIAIRFVPGVRLILPGTGPITAQVRNFINSTGFSGEFLLTEERLALEDVLAASDAAAHLPGRDGGVAAVSAAMAAGLPLIVTPTPDVLACAGSQEAVLAVAPGKPRQTAAAIATLAEQPQTAAALGQAVLRIARQQADPSAARQRFRSLLTAVFTGSGPARGNLL